MLLIFAKHEDFANLYILKFAEDEIRQGYCQTKMNIKI